MSRLGCGCKAPTEALLINPTSNGRGVKYWCDKHPQKLWRVSTTTKKVLPFDEDGEEDE